VKFPGWNYHDATSRVSLGLSAFKRTFGGSAQANDDFFDSVSMHRNRGTGNDDIFERRTGLRTTCFIGDGTKDALCRYQLSAEQIMMNWHLCLLEEPGDPA
jgi:hypothetical protein